MIPLFFATGIRFYEGNNGPSRAIHCHQYEITWPQEDAIKACFPWKSPASRHEVSKLSLKVHTCCCCHVPMKEDPCRTEPSNLVPVAYSV